MNRISNRQMRVFVMLASALLCAGSARWAAAGTVTYFGADASILPSYPNSLAAANSFLANVAGGGGTDNLDSYTPAAGPDPTNAPNLSFGATGITATEAFAGVQASGGIGISISPPNTLLAYPPLAPDTMHLSAPVTAFGAYFLNAGDTDPDTLSLQLDNSVTLTSQTLTIGTFGPNASNFNGAFFGVTTSIPFDTVTLLQLDPNNMVMPPPPVNDGVLLDNITVGTAVPEPSSLALLFGGVAGLGLIFRKRGHATAK